MRVRRAIESFVLQKKLTPRKLRNLLTLAGAAERLSSVPYMPQSEINDLIAQFGVAPDVTTWGDFFAAEIATDHWEKPDAEFEKICETVLFDFIAAALIFSGRGEQFVRAVLADYASCLNKPLELRSDDDEEKIHLGILAGYYSRMGLDKNRLNESDMAFFESFSLKSKIA